MAADLAVGISKTTVEALVNKVKTAIKEEAELWQTVQRDTMFMKDEFEMMQSFLKTADWERITNSVVRTWVKQVRDLSYDAEDCIESVLLMDTKRSLWTLCLRLLASCNCSSPELPPLDQAVAEVKLLKARVEEVRNRSMRYSLVSDSSDSNSMPVKLQEAPSAVSAVKILTEAWRIEKKQGGLVDLAMLVTESSNALRVISLWETGGHLGMTSIIKEAYEKEDIRQKFRARAWLKLAHPFNPHEFIRSLAHQFYGNSRKEPGGEIQGLDFRMESAQCTDLVKEFVQQLDMHRYLVVIEGLSNMAEWYAVRTYLPDSRKGSRIVVSTQYLEIARLCTGQNHQVLELRKLPDNHSVCVFFHEGFKRVEEGMVDGGTSLLGTAAKGKTLVGRNSDVDELVKLVSPAVSENAHVISVCGFPGHGKSTLVRSIFQHQIVRSLFVKYIWVDVAYPFNFIKFCQRMRSFMLQEAQAKFVYMPKHPEPEEEIVEDCKKFLQTFRCLVVIDGLRSREEWALIKSLIRLPSTSRILVVTAEKDIARYCAQPDDAIYEVRALQFEAALQLFRQEFRETGAFRDAHMLKEIKYVLEKCGGIPEVIVSLGRFLGTQSEDLGQLRLKLSRLKANFMHELETNPEFFGLRDLFAWMHFSYDKLQQCLKPCILYQSVFLPQVNKTIIRRSRFVRRWIAEGYSKSTDRKTMEEYAGELFSMLARQKAIVPALRDNSFFHEYIKSRLMEERVVFFPPVVTVLDESGSITTECQGQHLTIASSWKRDDEFLFEEWDFSHLQSLTVYGQWRPFFIPCKMRSLRVLDLEGTSLVRDDELNRFLELLPRLRFVSFRGHKEISRLPDSLFGLRHLQTLDIRGTSVVYVELQKLHRLQYIRAGTNVPWTDDDGLLAAGEQLTPSSISSHTLVSCLPKFIRCGRVVPCNGVRVPSRGIRHLQTLHTLGAINVNTADGEALLDEICHLKLLKKLDVSGINRKNSKKLSHAIINKNLESLTLQLEKEKHVVRWVDISPPSSVRSLKLYGHVEELSALRMKNLQNLRKLSLEMTRLFKPEDIQLLGRVSNLHILRLRVNKDQDGVLQISSNLFSGLHEFEISCRSRLHVMFDEGTMVKLVLLKVHCCNGSVMRFSGLKHPVSLKELWLKGFYDNRLTEKLKKQLAKHLHKPSLKELGTCLS